MIFIITKINANPVNYVSTSEKTEVQNDSSTVEAFKTMVNVEKTKDKLNNSNYKSDAESVEEISTIISSEAAYQRYDFGTAISSESAYQKYATEVSKPEQVEGITKDKKIATMSVSPTSEGSQTSQQTSVSSSSTENVNNTNNNNNTSATDYFKNGKSKVVEGVEKYRDIVQREAAKYGLQDYTSVILSLIMQESGGRVADVMQSSESAGLKPNAIKDPEQSIAQGIKHFASVFESANGDIPLTLQAYNFGGYFIKWLKKNELEGYSAENAQLYSNWLQKNYGMKGDPKYVEHVLRYYEK
ncbi:lysozyme family protein [Priestia filamentosa]|uniref:lysozyme family protein n=1 Tax=Priestia filamentosa TaxID=1402861 RepID=UPI00397A73A1